MASPEENLAILQHAIQEAVVSNDYSFLNSNKTRASLRRLVKTAQKVEEHEALTFGIHYRPALGSDYCSVDNREHINTRLHQIIGQPLTLPMGIWLKECIENGMFTGMNNDDYQ